MEITTRPKRLLALDTETTPRWWWYDGKATNRTMIVVLQWLDSPKAFGWIALPDVVLADSGFRYSGLPVTNRATMLGLTRAAFSQADGLIGHNLTRFDIPNLNGEAKILNLPMMPKLPVVDTLTRARKVGGQAMSLANRLSRLPGAVRKPHVDPVIWEAAFHDFDPDALAEVWKRATADVEGHIELFLNDHYRGYLS